MEFVEEYKKWLEPPENAASTWYRQRGFAFERILKSCLSHEGMDPRSSYKAEGEQIDGSFFLDGSVFLLEAKWHKDELPASSIYQFKGKVDGKLAGTIGVFISMSGYSKDAVDALTLGKSLNVILFGKEDIDAAIIGKSSFKNVLKSKLRIAAEEGVVYHSSEVEQVSKDGQTIIEAFSYDNMFSSIVKQDANFESTSDLVVVCEGQTDRELIALLATKILNKHRLTKKVNIIVAMGKMTIPRVANAASNIVTQSPILIVTDSDNDFDKTRDMLNRGVELDSWKYSIPDPEIEAWLGLDRREFRRHHRGEMMRSKLNELVNELDVEELAERDSSFNTFYQWVISA
ncbi:TOPRIM nucleotidyl transferase/hydrolase domain-containing protein [Pseudoalteromonas sp. OOF1S-7]|uniref:restriction endonuclease n=1 Tax=Pseudoalteromonas sp. OOF1S-7 TaxID=2917757 RepID=UPI001EF45F29|nr:TOPRIM nucleotidyl transferase/hydrolase domain-containing protein [Pseudoalteromonas sp. OOF1S-7]MCG7535047.1 restriction endonuclease [Pseudoalteromonas sp. OOF1S-7]